MAKLTLTKRFAVFLLSLIFIIGLLINLGVTRIIEAHTLKLVAHITGEYVEDLLTNSIPSNFFNEPLNTKDYNYLNKILNRDFFAHNVVSIKVWDRKGMLLYSDDKKNIGSTFAISNALKQAFNGETFTEVINLGTNNEKDKFDRLINVYSPIRTDGGNKILGAYEILWDFSEVSDSIRHTYEYIWVILIIGFTFIFFSLYATIKNTSRTLENQTETIRTLSGRLKQSLEEKLSTLIAVLDAKDNYTASHSLRVADYSLKIGQAIGMPKNELKVLEQAALLHDIGKIGVPEQVLNKPGLLTDEELLIIKQHPSIGAHIVQQSAALSAMENIIRYHHERYDGKGYPQGLKGEEIPLESRIMAIADSFDAITTDRPYRKGMSFEKGLQILNEVKGTQLDASLVEVFVQMILANN